MQNGSFDRGRRRSSTVMNEFTLETKRVVLNFIGLMPSSCPPTARIELAAEQAFGVGVTGGASRRTSDVTGDSVGSDRRRRSSNMFNADHGAHHERLAAAGAACPAATPTAAEDDWPFADTLTYIQKRSHVKCMMELHRGGSQADRNKINGQDSCWGAAKNGPPLDGDNDSSLDHLELAPALHITPASPQTAMALLPPFIVPNIGNRGMLDVNVTVCRSMSDDSVESGASNSHSISLAPGFSTTASGHLSPNAYVDCPLAERQTSCNSNASNSSRMSVRSCSYIDIRQTDVGALRRAHNLSPIALPLREEIFREMEDLQQYGAANHNGNHGNYFTITMVTEVLAYVGRYIN